jgi:hypothetical protein
MKRLVMLALLVCGCGASSSPELPAATPTIDISRFGPRHAVAGATPAPIKLPALRGSVPAGEVGVVDVSGLVSARPEMLQTSEDASLQHLAWSSWSADGASASGEFRVLDCQPNCATGHSRKVPATVALSGVKTCDGRRYFGRAVVKLASGPAPTSYVRAPC